MVSVSSGFSAGKEINTVHYVAEEISMETMVNALKRAGTYRGVALD